VTYPERAQLMTLLATRATLRVPHVEQEMFTLLEFIVHARCLVGKDLRKSLKKGYQKT
jgi:hypothetical protein